MQYALDKNNLLVHVDSVGRGYACNCICPYCKKPLSARQGNNTHSFAHRPKEGCGYGYQTSLHLLAKEIIKDGCRIKLPSPLRVMRGPYEVGTIPVSTLARYPLFIMSSREAYRVSEQEYDLFAGKINSLAKTMTIDSSDPSVSVELEENGGEGIIPDVVLSIHDSTGKIKTKLIIEIYVTHKVDDDKYERIKSIGVSAVEFDLHRLNRDEINLESLRMIFRKGTDCSWIYNRKVESLISLLETEREKKKNELLEAESGKTCKYPVYYRSKYRSFKGHQFIEGDLDYNEFVIYDPPCGGMETREKSRIVRIEKCRDGNGFVCPFYRGEETGKVGENASPNRTDKVIICNRKRKKEKNN